MHNAAERMAPVFAALGDPTRLGILATLCESQNQTISQLASTSQLTRQGLTRHLQVLEDAGIVASVRSGRERRFRVEPDQLREMQAYLQRVSRHWDEALGRLKSFVEK